MNIWCNSVTMSKGTLILFLSSREKRSFMKKYRKAINEFIIITIGTTIIAAAVYFFLVPSHLSIGSISGLAIVLSNFIPLPVSAITMVLNVVLLIVGFLFIGKEFGTKTIYTSILLPALLALFEHVAPNNPSIMQDPFLDMICYLFIVSLGLAILFNLNASSGGLDIVAKLLNKFLHMELGTAISVSGMVVALSSALVSDVKIVVLSILGTYLNGIILDRFIFGFTIKKRVCILSEKDEEIRDFIINELRSGATAYEVVGAYNMEPRREIVTIVDKHEYLKLIGFLEKVDSNAFVTVYDVSKAMYRPKGLK